MITKDKTVRASLINLAIAKNDVLLRSENLPESVKARHRHNLIEAYEKYFRRDDEYEQAKVKGNVLGKAILRPWGYNSNKMARS